MLEVAGSPDVSSPVCTPCKSGSAARSPQRISARPAGSASRAQPLAELREASSFVMLLGGWRNIDPHLSQECASLKPRPAARSSARELSASAVAMTGPGPEPVVPNPGCCSLQSPGELVGLVAGCPPSNPSPPRMFLNSQLILTPMGPGIVCHLVLLPAGFQV